GLCAAVDNLERKGGRRQSPAQLPRIVRRLSTEDMSKAVLRLRARLLNDAYAEPALVRSFCRWVQQFKPKALVGALRALGCECDDTGTLLGDIQHQESELARRQLLSIEETCSAYELS